LYNDAWSEWVDWNDTMKTAVTSIDLDMAIPFYTDVISANLGKTTCVGGVVTVADEDTYSYEKYFMATTAESNIVFFNNSADLDLKLTTITPV
jgi:hypothetical protein